MCPQGSERSSIDLFPAAGKVHRGHGLSQVKTNGMMCPIHPSSLSYLEDGIHYAAEGSVIGEFCHTKDIKAPLVQIVQLLKAQRAILKHEVFHKHNNSSTPQLPEVT